MKPKIAQNDNKIFSLTSRGYNFQCPDDQIVFNASIGPGGGWLLEKNNNHVIIMGAEMRLSENANLIFFCNSERQ